MTDHKAKAEEFAGIEVKGNNHTEAMLQVIANTIGAQVHATLYLTEQQRIANLISLRACDDPDLRAIAAAALFDGAKRRLRDEIKKGLGL